MFNGSLENKIKVGVQNDRRSHQMENCLLTGPPATNAVPLAGSTLRFDLPCALCLFRRPALLPFHLFRPFPYLSPKYKKT